MQQRQDSRMPETIAAPARELPVALRTHLLYLMLTVRHLHAGGVPPGALTSEAIVVGIGAALGPADIIRFPECPRPEAIAARDLAVTVRPRHGAPGNTDGVYVLLAPMTPNRGRRPVTVDGWDVEAMLVAIAGATRAVRAGGGTRLLRVQVPGPAHPYDPIAVLSGRMRTAGQLDDNAVLAIDDHARRAAGALVRETPPLHPFPPLITQALVVPAPACPDRAGPPRR
jgi:hypothetical protein